MTRAHIWLVAILAQFCGFGALGQASWWMYLDGPKAPAWLPLATTSVPAFSMCLVGFLYLWCRADAKGRRISLAPGISILVPLLFPIGIPYYYLRTYPTRSAIFHICLAAIFAVACFAAGRLGAELVFRYFAVWTNHPRGL